MRYFLIFAAIFCLFEPDVFSQNNELKSRAERSNYEETSLYPDIITFLNLCKSGSADLQIEYFMKSAENKDIPLAVISDKNINNKNKIKIFIVAGIHSGEVDGKEASFVLIRELLFGKLHYLLAKCSVFILPTLNVDGNDKIDRYNRLSQNGPSKGVGLADFPNGMNINRDFSKHEIPETEALIKLIDKYDPEIIIDCHTTNGSYHAYALTYAPPLNPNTNRRITGFLKNELFPVVTKKLFSKFNYRTQYYGNFKSKNKPEDGWETFNYRPRYSNNYFGLINKIGILGEGYSYLELKKRIDVTSKFITEIMDYAYRNVRKIKRIIKNADSDNSKRSSSFIGNEIAVKCELFEAKSPIKIYTGAVDSVKDLTGRGYTFKMKESYAKPVMVKDFTNFKSSQNVKMPYAYFLPAKFKVVVDNIIGHGIRVSQISDSIGLDVEVFLIDSIKQSRSKFQAHNPISVTGKYINKYLTIQKGDYCIFMGQNKSNLIPQLLEPYCEDGYLYWNFFDDYFMLYCNQKIIQYPVVKLLFPKDLKSVRLN
jgi:hypothetical protein